MSEEIWKPIPGLKGFEASDLGRIRSWRGANQYETLAHPRLRSLSVKNNGYLEFKAHDGVKRRGYLVHRVILFAFIGEPPSGTEAAHLDGNRQNNRIDNLQWKTHSENLADRIRHGTHLAGERAPRAKLTEAQVREVRDLDGISQKEIGRRYGITQSAVSLIRNRKNWKEAA